MSIDNLENRGSLLPPKIELAAGVSLVTASGSLLLAEIISLTTGTARTDTHNIVPILDHAMREIPGIMGPSVLFRLGFEGGGVAFGLFFTIDAHAKIVADTIAQRLRKPT